MAKPKKKPRRTGMEIEKLKPKFFEAIDAGLSKTAAHQAIGVSASTSERWLQERETGYTTVAAKNASLDWAEIAAYATAHSVEEALAHYDITASTYYKYVKRRRLAPVPTNGRANGSHSEPTRVTTSATFGATSKIMQILEPLSDAERTKVASAIQQLVQGGIG